MALDLASFRAALAAQINSYISGSEYPANVYDYAPDSPALNAVIIRPKPSDDFIAYRGTFGANALTTSTWEIEVRCSNSMDGDKAMDCYMSTGTPASIIDAIDTDRTLGGVVGDCTIMSASSPTIFDSGDRSWLAARFTLELREAR